MTFDLDFLSVALKEWGKLPPDVRSQLKKKLKERLKHPEVPSDRLRGHRDFYKIKLRSSGYRLVYRVNRKQRSVLVVVVNKRDKDLVYQLMNKRIKLTHE